MLKDDRRSAFVTARKWTVTATDWPGCRTLPSLGNVALNGAAGAAVARTFSLAVLSLVTRTTLAGSKPWATERNDSSPVDACRPGAVPWPVRLTLTWGKLAAFVATCKAPVTP